MSDNYEENEELVEPDNMDETIYDLIDTALDEACAGLEEGDTFSPFTLIVEDDEIYEMRHFGDDMDDIVADARSFVKNGEDNTHYLFCYDGFLSAGGKSEIDAIIMEVGSADMPKAYSIALAYSVDDDGEIEYDEAPTILGDTDSMFF